MIVYNIRANGPYEYDKFILNFGQLHNLYVDIDTLWKSSEIKKQDKKLTEEIQKITDPEYALNKIMALKGLVTQ